jgi:predicted esterase
MKNKIRYEAAAHYYRSHIVNRMEEEIWFVLHGYGQLGSLFLEKFKPYFNDKRLFIAPEANNHAYLEGFSGKVGANWMTRHERLTAIENNNNFLNSILQTYLLKFNERPKIKVFGFSQGAATATRWVDQLSVPIETLVLWGGGFAEDLKEGTRGTNLQNSKVFVVVGDNDPFVTESSMHVQKEIMDSLGLKAERINFKGGHELEFSVLKRIFDSE